MPGPEQQEQWCLCGSGGCSRAMASGGTRSACGVHFLFVLGIGCGHDHSTTWKYHDKPQSQALKTSHSSFTDCIAHDDGTVGLCGPRYRVRRDSGREIPQSLGECGCLLQKNKIGPYLDRSDYESMRNAGATDCEVLKVKPFDLSAVLATPEGKFAYSIKLPAPLDKPRVRRADYRSAEDYFQALCEREAGDTVIRKQIDVVGVAQLRMPMRKPMLDGLGSYSEESSGTPFLAIHSNPPGHLVQRDAQLFHFMEIVTALSSDGLPLQITRYTRGVDEATLTSKKLLVETVSEFKANFGYLWRGTPQFDDRENGIIGGELIVLNTDSREILGVRRIFYRDDVNLSIKDRVQWDSRRCPSVKTEGLHFVVEILNPTKKNK